MNRDVFINEFSRELLEGYGVYFVGAGISVPSSLPGWEDLLKSSAENIGIKRLKRKDLTAIAQYIINEETGNRGPFINTISRRLRKNYSPNTYHELIAKTNLKTIWTTNYDNLLEKAFVNHIIDVKTSDDAVSRNIPDAQVEIIKMHGCIFNSNRDEIVVTESDYEDFFINKPATSHRLKLELVQKSFLFIGYSFKDPNIKNIVTEARRLARNSTRQHYMILKRSPGREFALWCNNLRKYGISVVTIEEHRELEEILEELALKSRGKSVFVTGSHGDKANPNAKLLGEKLAEIKDVILMDGQSSGVMRYSASAYTEKVIEQKNDVNKRLRFFPNPYAANPKFGNDNKLIPLLKQWRLPLFKATQVVIAFDGGMGTQAEIEIALDMGCIVLPFFQTNGNGLLHELLKNKTFKRNIHKYDPNYLDRIDSNTLEIDHVLTVVKSILNR